MPTVNSLPDYITVSYPIALERVCRNCRFWIPNHCNHPLNIAIGSAIVGEIEDPNFQIGYCPPSFGCIHFEVKDGD